MSKDLSSSRLPLSNNSLTVFKNNNTFRQNEEDFITSQFTKNFDYKYPNSITKQSEGELNVFLKKIYDNRNFIGKNNLTLDCDNLNETDLEKLYIVMRECKNSTFDITLNYFENLIKRITFNFSGIPPLHKAEMEILCKGLTKIFSKCDEIKINSIPYNLYVYEIFKEIFTNVKSNKIYIKLHLDRHLEHKESLEFVNFLKNSKIKTIDLSNVNISTLNNNKLDLLNLCVHRQDLKLKYYENSAKLSMSGKHSNPNYQDYYDFALNRQKNVKQKLIKVFLQLIDYFTIIANQHFKMDSANSDKIIQINKNNTDDASDSEIIVKKDVSLKCLEDMTQSNKASYINEINAQTNALNHKLPQELVNSIISYVIGVDPKCFIGNDTKKTLVIKEAFNNYIDNQILTNDASESIMALTGSSEDTE